MSYVYLADQMRTRFWFLLGVIVLGLTLVSLQSCAGLPKPETQRQTLAYVDATLTGLINAAATARELGTLSSKNAALFKTSAKEIEAYIDLSKIALAAGDFKAMDVSLSTARTLLIALNKMLLEMEKP